MALEHFGVEETLPEGLASNDQHIYMIGQNNKTLYRVDPVTSETKAVGGLKNFGVGESRPVDLTFHKDVLYMTGRTGKCLYKVSTDTGKATKLGTQKNFGGVESKPQGLASDGETLYMTGAQQNMLYSVETEGTDAGKATKIGSFEDRDDEPKGLTYHPEEKQLYMLGGEHNSLYSVDSTTGQATKAEHPDSFDVDEDRPTGVTYHKENFYITGQKQAKLYKLDENGAGKLVEKFEGVGEIVEPDPSGAAGKFRPDSSQVRVQSGGQSRLLFAEQPNYWTARDDVDEFYKYQPIVTTIGLTDQTATIPIEFLKGSADANKQQAGGFAYSGGFGIGASRSGTQLFFKGITNGTLGNGSNKTIRLLRTSENSTNNVTGVSIPNGSDKRTIGTIGDSATSLVWPQRLTVSSTGTTGAGKEIVIEGYDYHNQKVREVISATNRVITKETQTYFRMRPSTTNTNSKSVVALSEESGVRVSTSSGLGATITSLNEAQQVTFMLDDNKDFKGWTVEAQKGGGVCHTYVGVVPVSFTTSLARDSALTFDFECLAYNMNPYENAKGEATRNQAYGSGGTRPSAGMDITSASPLFETANQELATGWQCSLRVKSPGDSVAKTIPLVDATFTVNQTIEQAQIIMGERNPGPYFRSGLREVTVSGNMLLDRDRDWISEFRANSEFEECILTFANAPIGSFPSETIFEFGRGQLTTAPDASVDGLGLVTVPFNMSFYANSANDANRFKIIAIYDQEDWFEFTNGGLAVNDDT